MADSDMSSKETTTKRPPLALIGLPQDNNSSFLAGPRLAPPLIRAAMTSPSANMFAETGTDLGPDTDAGPDTVRLWQDAGDLALHGLSGKPAFDAVHDGIADRLADGQAVISLGGDHSVTWPAVTAHTAYHQRLTIRIWMRIRIFMMTWRAIRSATPRPLRGLWKMAAQRA